MQVISFLFDQNYNSITGSAPLDDDEEDDDDDPEEAPEVDEVPDLEISISLCTEILKIEASNKVPKAGPQNQPQLLAICGENSPHCGDILIWLLAMNIFPTTVNQIIKIKPKDVKMICNVNLTLLVANKALTSKTVTINVNMVTKDANTR